MKSKKIPKFFKPMLATLVDEAFDDKDWLFEIKWDGYRTLAFIEEDVELFSRNHNPFNTKFKPIVDELKKINKAVILDGEVVVLDEKGRSDFQLMQNYQTSKEGNLAYYVFDLLFLEGVDLRNNPLIERKKLLKEFLNKFSFENIFYGEHVLKKGKAFYLVAEKNQIEGIVAKKIDSVYVSQRSKNWLKIKTHHRQEVVIGGFTEPRGSRKYFGALLVGVYDDKGDFIYIGHTGGGFNEKLLQEIYQELIVLKQEKCPFKERPKPNAKVTWVEPKLVCEISFSEWTDERVMRQPIFMGMRMDKKAKTVKKEEAIKIITSKPIKNKVIITHPDKVYWPEVSYTKQDLVNYYDSVLKEILPFLKNRPLMMKRFPDGVEGNSFIQKDVAMLHLPNWVKAVKIEHSKKDLTYIMVQDQKTLDYVVNLGTIELHPFLTEIKTPDHPNYFVIDLDPEKVEFKEVMKVAQEIYSLLKSIDVDCYVKTSGKRGLHICLPLGKKYTYEQAFNFGLLLANHIHAKIPDSTSLERKPADRQHKIYLDVFQNHDKQTVIAPYSARATPLATVSTPLNWDELKGSLTPEDFTIKTLPIRLKKLGDIFKPVLGKGINIQSSLKKLEKQL